MPAKKKPGAAQRKPSPQSPPVKPSSSSSSSSSPKLQQQPDDNFLSGAASSSTTTTTTSKKPHPKSMLSSPSSPVVGDDNFDRVDSNDWLGAAEKELQDDPPLARLLAKTELHSIPDIFMILMFRLLTKKRVWGVLCVLVCYTCWWQRGAIMETIPDAWQFDVSEWNPASGIQVEEVPRPGLEYRKRISDAASMRPVVQIPGFITSALEVFESRACLKSDYATNFRQRIFGPVLAMKLMTDPSCYVHHLALHPLDEARDPIGIKIRADTGYDATDFVGPTGSIFWVWAKLSVNLADVSYDPRTYRVSSFDWRLSPEGAERRDTWMTRLKHRVEQMMEVSEQTNWPEEIDEAHDAFDDDSSTAGTDYEKEYDLSVRSRPLIRLRKQPKQKAVLVTHSYGCNVLAAFLSWADEQEPGWVDRHVHTCVLVGGPLLGIAKANSALLSGEVKDFQTMPAIPRRIFNTMMDRRNRARAVRTWGCLHAMMTRGPEVGSRKAMFRWSNTSNSSSSRDNKVNLTMRESLTLLRRIGAATFGVNASMVKYLDKLLSEKEPTVSAKNQHRFVGKLPHLPKAPNLHIVCMYGVSQQTETSFYIKQDNISDDESIRIDGDVNVPEKDGNGETTTAGIVQSEGDGTVDLLSMGYMCRSKRRGFARTVGKVTTIELKFNASAFDLLKRPSDSAEHIDSIGNHQTLRTVLDAAMGFDEDIKEEIFSNIDELVKEIDEID